MSEPFIGEIRCFGFNFAPRSWAFCNGQLLQIAQNTALFSILGTFYGGDGRTTFALPNLQGRIPMHWGNSPGGLDTRVGEVLGQTTVTLTANEIPAHDHAIIAAEASTVEERSVSPTNTSFVGNAKGGLIYQVPPVTANAPFSPRAISETGGSQAHNNMQPYLVLNFCIALFGIFPSRG